MSGETVIGETTMRAEKTGGDIEVGAHLGSRRGDNLYHNPDKGFSRD